MLGGSSEACLRGGETSANSINRAASQSFYVVEANTPRMEQLNHRFLRSYRIYKQQPKKMVAELISINSRRWLKNGMHQTENVR